MGSEAGAPPVFPELAVGTMGGAGAHDPWATAKHASGVRRALTPEGRAPPILDLRRAKNTVSCWAKGDSAGCDVVNRRPVIARR